MSKTFDQGREEIAKLCKYFATNRQAFFAHGVKEAHVRQSLIDPFFEALGWDLRNTAMVAPQYREVVTEDSLEIEGQQKAPDYTFRVGTLAKFYTEAKKCGININADPGPAYQLRRYGWSAKVPLSILTDFEELGVYDCTIRPRPIDKASYGRIQYFRSEEYPDRWRELWDIFSREAVWAGAYDRYAASKRKRGTSEVDNEFLKEIEGWRDSLARNIALRNLYLGYDDLNTAVQRTIDRIIFLRMAEDRGSESYGQLLKLCEQPEIYAQFMKLCRKADEKYNSGIFHFQKEDGVSEQPDRLTPALTIDDKVIKPILQSLYFENGSPYHFGVLPVEILGTVYERFLGKVIRLTAEHRAKVEEKPEVRKAGGVYYTPAYIVDYIVKNTVGKVIEGKSPAQLAGGKNGQPLRVLDMACGSGSFLLGAYQCLLDHCQKWYLENRPEKHKEAVYLDRRGKYWRLAIAEKKRILITHIFGVDIDLQAVEVSKLSLLLKVLEGETDETVGQSRQLFHERALPNLSNNIKCGNSLIGPDYFSGRLIPDPDEMKRVNPFDWQREFPAAMKSGGFDCVIGNPPYGAMLGPKIKKFLINAHPSVSDFETSQFFISKSEHLIKNKGYVSFIIPNTIFLNLYASKFRKFVANNFFIECIVDLADVDVFDGATVRTSIPFLLKNIDKNCSINVVSFSDLRKFNSIGTLNQIELEKNDNAWNMAVGHSVASQLREKIEKDSHPLGDILAVSQGLIPYDKYRGHDEFTIKNRIWHADKKKDKTYKRELRGGDIKRYSIHWNGIQWISYGPWLAAPRKPEFFISPRLLFREITDPKSGLLHVTYSNEEFYNNPGIINCISLETQYSLFYILGLCASRLIAYLHFSSSPKARKGVFPKILVNDVRNLPIHRIDFSNQKERACHDHLEKLVKSMLELNNQIVNKKTEFEERVIQRQIDTTDCEIDRLVYELYGLTEEEIKIVDDATAK